MTAIVWPRRVRLLGVLGIVALAGRPLAAQRDFIAPARLARAGIAVGLLVLAACIGRPVEQRSAQLALDSSAVRRLCVRPDSVLAARGPCVLRDQAPVLIREVPRP